jgi:hypothetical protein
MSVLPFVPVLVFNSLSVYERREAQQQQSLEPEDAAKTTFPERLHICHSRQRREPDYFGIANRAGADSYFFMNRLVSATSLAIATLLVLTGCATDDDPFPVHPAATTTDSELPVAGAAIPAGESSSAGWKW